MYKHVGRKAYITKDGFLYGKTGTVCGVIDSENYLISCDWHDSTYKIVIPAKYLTIELPINK